MRKIFDLVVGSLSSVARDILSDWRKAFITLIAGAGIAFGNELLTTAKSWMYIHIYGFTDIETSMKYARLTPNGSRALSAIGYYDVESRKQYIAAAFDLSPMNVTVKAFEIIAHVPYPIGMPIDASWSIDKGQTVNLIKDQEKNLHFFGFVDLIDNNHKNKLMLYGVKQQFFSEGWSTEVSLAPLDSNIKYTVRDDPSNGMPGMQPLFSKNIPYDSVKNWLALKSFEVIMHGDNWDTIPLSKFKDGLFSGESEIEWFPGTYIKKWYEANGVDKFDGDVQMISVPAKYYRAEDTNSIACSISVGDDEWLVLFKGPIMKYSPKNHTYNVAYMQDSRNYREAGGIINGKDYLWFGVSSNKESNIYYLAMRKLDGKLIGFKVNTLESTVLPDETDPDDMEPPLIEESEGMELPTLQQNDTHGDFHYSNSAVYSEGNKIQFDASSLKSHGVTFENEFSGATNCSPDQQKSKE
ncbi:hypothetical protein DXT77_14740 [Pseudomonas sp. 91RF]|jgi:hypothetical protein|uniref:hypothetical protein n=1 Tax=Pseudomonas sp. 91RF TaxID=2292261 RepID=UPI000E6745A0|nr:hypothetical protein [Pseudomonas sp. 91RF]RIJ09703.1 hypothetical protein DXT77_14740 [Pseudomonas sp. 91RF]